CAAHLPERAVRAVGPNPQLSWGARRDRDVESPELCILPRTTLDPPLLRCPRCGAGPFSFADPPTVPDITARERVCTRGRAPMRIERERALELLEISRSSGSHVRRCWTKLLTRE